LISKTLWNTIEFFGVSPIGLAALLHNNKSIHFFVQLLIYKGTDEYKLTYSKKEAVEILKSANFRLFGFSKDVYFIFLGLIPFMMNALLVT